jgi:tRNA(Ile)-lysidine synthase
MRMARGSGIAGLAGMARLTERDGIQLARPFLHIAKAQLVTTLTKAKIDFATDPSNSDPSYTRPRLRALMPALASEGFDSRNLARLATRLRRADAALELMVDGAERFLALHSPGRVPEAIDAGAFAGLAEEIRVRLLLRMIDQVGHEGPAELGKVETLVFAIVQATRSGGKGTLLKQTLAGAMITLTQDRLRIVPAPPRRRRAD